MSDRGRRKFWLFGCLAVVGTVALAAATIAALTWFSIRSAQPQSSVLVHEPEIEVRGANQSADPTTPSGGPLRIRLELDSCEIYIEPAAPGEPLNLEAHYDARDYRLEETVEEGAPDTYRIRFLVDSSRLITGIKQAFRGGQPQLRLRLPVDTPIELSLLQRNGGAVVDLSGLQLRAADFDAGGALLKLDADEPLRGELQQLVIRGRQGGLVVESLNLMRPKRIDVDFRMGQALFDFRGPWAADTAVDLQIGMADVIVRLPREAHVSGLPTERVAPPIDREIAPPTLDFTVGSGRRTTLRVFE